MPKTETRQPEKTKTVAYDVAEQLRTREEMAAYLDAWLSEAPDDVAGIARALGDIARAKGMSQVVRNAGLSRESLYKALSESGKSELRHRPQSGACTWSSVARGHSVGSADNETCRIQDRPALPGRRGDQLPRHERRSEVLELETADSTAVDPLRQGRKRRHGGLWYQRQALHLPIPA